MGANSSTRRVSFESDENENISVVKGIRLSENVLNRMREPEAPPKKQQRAPTRPPPLEPTLIPSPLLRPVPPPFDPITSLPPPFDPITSLPPPPPLVEPVAPPPAPLVTETVATPPAPPPPQPPAEQVAAPTIAPPAPLATETVATPPPPPPPQPPAEQLPVEPVPAAPVPEPVAVPESIPVPPPPPPPPAVDEEALRKKISVELHKGFEEERAKAEQELQAWLDAEKTRAAEQATADAQSQVPGEVSRMLSVERALVQENLQQTLIRERIITEDEKHRAQIYAKQLEAREADLKKQDVFYREQVARLEERSAQFYKVTTENYHKAADQVNAKFRRYEMYPVCTDLQGQILACYRENVGKTLHCSNIAALYLQCVNNSKQNKLRTGG
ncbi:coiled-coil-helix-coiled-coil-helix domain containing 3a [Limanda limanda]|uniref:coiled-coil-helix-coiled-coil-helix domain containing 3a n=1 Tax=Limanda limanda TaxID=27771 RepID=UPI0029C718AA|nr:coiled-coil-helix-coiled-coil-helix domain containing 3a [Limanda limanda]